MRERVNVAVVGAGPAGIAAAIYLKRAGWEPLLIDERGPGGLVREACLVENYPGFPEGISGADLADLMTRQVDRLKVRFEKTRVFGIARTGHSFVIESEAGPYASEALILATGTAPKRATIQGQETVDGYVHYGISSIGIDHVAGKRIAVLGGGDAAFDYAINLANHGCAVTVVSRSPPVCLPLLRQRAKERGVEVLEGCEPERLTKHGEGVMISCASGHGPTDVTCDSIVIAHGREPRLDVIDRELEEGLLESKDSFPGTGIEGFFAVGDVVRGANRQTAIAVGDGVLAAMIVERLLKDRGVER